jgi:hypothetical protein
MTIETVSWALRALSFPLNNQYEIRLRISPKAVIEGKTWKDIVRIALKEKDE